MLSTEIGQQLSETERELQDQTKRVYQARLAAGVAREQARMDLLLSTYTEAYWKVDLHNLLHFLALRMDSHAQQEIRDYATTIGEQIVGPLFPVVWEAFQDYRIGGSFLTRLDVEVIRRLMTRGQETGQPPPFDQAMFLAAQDPTWEPLTRCRERDECHDKLEGLGIVAPRDTG